MPNQGAAARRRCPPSSTHVDARKIGEALKQDPVSSATFEVVRGCALAIELAASGKWPPAVSARVVSADDSPAPKFVKLCEVEPTL